MRNSKFLIIIILLQLGSLFALSYCHFSFDTSKMLEIFVSSIWGSVFSLGACIIYLLKRAKQLKQESKEADLFSNQKVVAISFWMLLSCIAFVLISSIYPAKSFIQTIWPKINENWTVLASIYDSSLFTLFIWPCLAAVLVGCWVLILEFESHK